jgi:hypothetical protein
MTGFELYGRDSRRRRGVSRMIMGISVLMILLTSTLVVQFAHPGFARTQPGIPNNIASVRSGYWSDSATWGGDVPGAGTSISIASRTSVTYDLPFSPNYGEITVSGSLVFSRLTSTSMSTTAITIAPGGYVEIGTIGKPIPAGVTTMIYLNSATEGGAKIHILSRGQLEIHGAAVGKTFSKLAVSARAGSTSLQVADPLQWRPGDHIVITSTSLFPSETEENYIAAVSGNVVKLVKPLNYSHDGIAPAQGEVADLTRNVIVTSLNSSVHAMGVMFMFGAKGSLSYAEFSHLGGEDVLGNYPIHFHHVQNSMVGTVLEGLSVWDSHNRFITIHNTNGITVKNTVGYMAIGHGFFLEDGTEQNNTLVNDISILTLPGMLRPDDGSPAGFWVQHARNNLTGDIAVSASGSGFDYSLPDTAPEVIPFDLGNFQGSLGQRTFPTQFNITAFKNNEAHSNAGDGLHLYRLDPGNYSSYNTFSGMKIWRNGGTGIDITGTPSLLSNSLLFGNRMGNIMVSTGNMTLRNMKVLGELPGLTALLNKTNAGTERYIVAPLGLVFTAANITILDSFFSGHLAAGNLPYGDVIHQPSNQGPLGMLIQNTALMSKHQLIFGYPLDDSSYMKVIKINLGGSSQSFVLYRYDTDHGPLCKVNLSYMALQCPISG